MTQENICRIMEHTAGCFSAEDARIICERLNDVSDDKLPLLLNFRPKKHVALSKMITIIVTLLVTPCLVVMVGAFTKLFHIPFSEVLLFIVFGVLIYFLVSVIKRPSQQVINFQTFCKLLDE